MMDWDRFQDYLKTKNLSDETISYYKIYFKRLSDAIGDIHLDQNIINAFISENPNIVSRAFLKNYLKHSGIKDIEIPQSTGKKRKRKITIIPKEHIPLLRSVLYDDNVRYGLLFDLTYYGALRRSEVLNITLLDVNIPEIKENKKAPVKILIRGKFNKQRYVLIPKMILKAMLLYAKEKGFNRADKLLKVDKKTWWRHFYNAQMKLGYSFVNSNGKIEALYHPHTIRHSRSSHWWEDGKDIVQIQRRLGHSDISTTRLYITPDDKKEEKIWGDEYV